MEYTFTNNTYVAVSKDDAKDRISVEVGDSKQPDFYPQVKLMRWDNEVNLSVRLVDEAIGKARIETDSDKIKWIKGKKEVHFYSKLATEQYEDGAYELEVVLKEKPTSNVLNFTIETKGLEFFKQPALSEEAIARGDYQPENVLGSYAVYYKDCPPNIAGGKVYQSGKAFHIYRPNATDAKGNTVWADLDIDEESETLTITIPQDFLDEAVYPVVVDPTFGNTNAGGTDFSLGVDKSKGWTATMGANAGTAQKITFNAKASSGTRYAKGFICLAATGAIITDGVGGAVSMNTSLAARDSEFGTDPVVAASTSYYLMVVSDGTNVVLRYDWAASGGVHDDSNSYTTPQNITAVGDNERINIYVTYTEGLPATGQFMSLNSKFW